MEKTDASSEQSSRRMSWGSFLIGIILFVAAILVGISDNPPASLSLLAGFFGIVLGLLYRFGKPGKRSPAQQLVYWAPRALCIAYAVFISLFALDAFGQGRGFWETLLGLLMHLIPTFLILVVLALSWRREWVGGAVFLALAAFYVVETLGKPSGNWSVILLISGPLALTGVLFLSNWFFREALRGGTS